STDDAEVRRTALQRLIDRSAALRATPHVVPLEACGADGERLWVASPLVEGRTAAEWLIRGGRMPPEIVLEIAREMVAALAVCEACGVLHGDISSQQLVLDPLGQVRLLEPGLRGVIRTAESDETCDAELSLEACDYLAPERAGDRASMSVTTELYA